MSRTFEDKEAVRDKVPLLIGLMGPSGGGKTYSALRLATGIRNVSGGEIFVIDTEAKRAKHYAGDFKFRHVEFGAPFCPLDYLAAIEHCVKKGAGVVIVDSMSHEHEGPGGVLEQHAAEVERLTKAWSRNGNHVNPEATNFPAWAEPKAKRRRLINSVVQLGVSAIFCFRAKEKSKPVKRGEVIDGKEQTRAGMVELGWMPIAGEEFVYEMGCNLLLDSGCDGKPTIKSDDIGTKRILKVPKQFRSILREGVQLSEQIGESMAQWSNGETGAALQAKTQKPQERPNGDIEDALIRLANAPDDEISRIAEELRGFSWSQGEAILIKNQLNKSAKPAEKTQEG